MNAQMTAKPGAARRPLTLFGFLAGLVLGLGIAAAAAVYLTKAPHHTLFSPHIPTAAAPPIGTPTPPDAGAAGAGAAAAAGRPVEPAAAAVAAPAADAGPRLMLQVGAYKSVEDADAARARLALLGLDGKVTEVQLDGATLYRVRLGPYGQLDDLNGIRRTLSENGMEPQLVHVH
jgi:cell division protein FtsN